LALLATLHVVWHRRKPNIDVEADLMASVIGEHRTAARLRHVANKKTIPANLLCVRGKPFNEANELWIAPVAVTRQAHDLPGGSSDRQRHSASEAAVEIAARRPGKWRRFACEQFFGRRRGPARILQWRQRLGIERAGGRRVNQVFFLRDGRSPGREDQKGEQASEGAHQQLYFCRSVTHWVVAWQARACVRRQRLSVIKRRPGPTQQFCESGHWLLDLVRAPLSAYRSRYLPTVRGCLVVKL